MEINWRGHRVAYDESGPLLLNRSSRSMFPGKAYWTNYYIPCNEVAGHVVIWRSSKHDSSITSNYFKVGHTLQFYEDNCILGCDDM
jgi:hypothetical protein